MMLTEAEAKTKWCPMARIISGSVDQGVSDYDTRQPTLNVIVDPENGNRNYIGRCAGSVCMMWRWNWKRNEDGVFFEDRTVGYCGLAR